MELPFRISDVLPYEVSVISRDQKLGVLVVGKLRTMSNEPPETAEPCSVRAPLDSLSQAKLFEIIDKMGEASRKAQKLDCPITSGEKLLESDHKLYILREEPEKNWGSVIGILKVGIKKLFITDGKEPQIEVYPYCVLDIYVCETHQNMGYGHKLFSAMLDDISIPVEQLAVDGPSAMYLSFIEKHYKLGKPIHQPNNFIVYPGFFNGYEAKEKRPRTEDFSHICFSVRCRWNKGGRARHSSYQDSWGNVLGLSPPPYSEKMKKGLTFVKN